MSIADPPQIEFFGDLTIGAIGAVHSALSRALSTEPAIVVAVDADAETDLTFVQLIEAARQEAERKGSSFRLAGPASGSFLETLDRGGFLGDGAGANAAFWQGGY